jgi:hypothetical protein
MTVQINTDNNVEGHTFEIYIGGMEPLWRVLKIK